MTEAEGKPRPDLKGLGVLVTRPAHQSAGLCRLIRDAGGRALEFPALEIAPGGDPERLQRIFAGLDRYRLAIFISTNAVDYAAPWIRRAGGLPPGLRLAAVGRATARALSQRLRAPEIVPVAGFDSESLLASPELQRLAGEAVLILRGDGGRPLLGDELRRRGAEVDYAEVYRRLCPASDPAPVLAQWDQVQLVIATSRELLDNLKRLFGARGGAALRARPLLVISPRLAEYARAQGFDRVLEAREASDEALLQAMAELVQGPTLPGGYAYSNSLSDQSRS
jgi:uroporphyrinogen-III synthase